MLRPPSLVALCVALVAALVSGTELAGAVGEGIVLSEDGGVASVGETRTVTATVRDQLGQPAPDGTRVTFVVTGSDGEVGSGVVAGPAVVAMAVTPAGDGYWLAGVDGTVLAFGGAPFLGDASEMGLSGVVVGIASTASGNGYWLATDGGEVLGFGDAQGAVDFRVALAGERVVGIARTYIDRYRLVTKAGRILPQSTDAWLGDLPSANIEPPDPILGFAGTTSGYGYWLYDARGRVYPFGDAAYRGSLEQLVLSVPVTGMMAYGDGYLMVGEGGGIFNFSSSPFLGSVGSRPPPSPITAMTAHPAGPGYWFVDLDGRVYPFGAAGGFGSTHTVATRGGQAEFSFTSWLSGTTAVRAVTGDFPFDPVTPPLSQVWRPGAAEWIDLASSAPSAVAGTSLSVTAAVADGFGNAVTDGTPVAFDARGTGTESPGAAVVPTSGGEARFSFTAGAGGYTTVTATAAAAERSVAVKWRTPGYWMLSSGGEVYAFGGAQDLGGQPPSALDIEPTPSGEGYWILDAGGRVFPKGDARDLGGTELLPGEKPVSLSATPDGAGYWIFTDTGRVIARGQARAFGDLAGVKLNGPVLDSVATPSGRGYWMVAADGGLFSFGDAQFFGSMGGTALNQPVVSMAPDPDGTGYWLVASDGGIFSFSAPFHGSTGNIRLNQPISGMVTGRGGYLMVARDGGIFAFGDVAFHGSLGDRPPPDPVVAVALLG